MGGDELRQARVEAGLTIDRFAQKVGVARRTVEGWESADGRVPMSRIRQVQTALRWETENVSLVNINVRLSVDLLRRVDDKADAEDRSRSQMVRLLIEKGLG